MKEFLVLSFSGQVGADEFDYSFVEANDEQDAYERIEEEGIGYPGGFVTNCLIALNQETIKKLKQMIEEVERKGVPLNNKAYSKMEKISGKKSEEAKEEEEEESGDFFGEPIYTYTSKQAVDDGILFDITKLNARFKKGLFNYVTANLLSNGYFGAGEQINLPNLIDLLNQAHNIVKTKTNNFKNFDTFFSGTIELPSGEKQKIFIQQNETGKFTIMLPQDY